VRIGVPALIANDIGLFFSTLAGRSASFFRPDAGRSILFLPPESIDRVGKKQMPLIIVDLPPPGGLDFVEVTFTVKNECCAKGDGGLAKFRSRYHLPSPARSSFSVPSFLFLPGWATDLGCRRLGKSTPGWNSSGGR